MTTALPLDHVSAKPDKPARHLVAVALFMLVGFAALWSANRSFAPEMYSRAGVTEIAKAFARGENYAVFDLNINIRELRDEHIARMTTTPDVAVLGASHWQEAHSWLVSHKNFYNAHVHRDYYEDMLGMVEMFERHNRLPKQLIIAVRDNQFTPIQDRKDHLWLPGVPYYRAMATRLGLELHPYHTTAPVARWRELLSLPMLHANAVRWGKAYVLPHATEEKHFDTLDTLLPGGSILWSKEHQGVFTTERTIKEVISFAERRVNDPPKVDPKGLAAFDRLLAHLRSKNVELYLAHPPFNPDYYDRVMKGPYADGLRRIEQITRDFAKKYDAKIIGSFNPADVGCDRTMYIDAEHANPDCLARLLSQYSEHDRQREPEAVVAMAAPQRTPAPKGEVPTMTVAHAIFSAPALIGSAPAPSTVKDAPPAAAAATMAPKNTTNPVVVAAAGETVAQPDEVKAVSGKSAVRLAPAPMAIQPPPAPVPAAPSVEAPAAIPEGKPIATKSEPVTAAPRKTERPTRQAAAPAQERVVAATRKSRLPVAQTNHYPNPDKGFLGALFGVAPKTPYVWPGDRPPQRARMQMSQSSQPRVR